MLALKLGRRTGVAKDRGQNLIESLNQINDNVSRILNNFDKIKFVAEETYKVQNFYI